MIIVVYDEEGTLCGEVEMEQVPRVGDHFELNQNEFRVCRIVWNYLDENNKIKLILG